MHWLKEQAEAITRHMRAVTRTKGGRVKVYLIRGTGSAILQIESKNPLQLAWFDGFIYSHELLGKGNAGVEPEDDE